MEDRIKLRKTGCYGPRYYDKVSYESHYSLHVVSWESLNMVSISMLNLHSKEVWFWSVALNFYQRFDHVNSDRLLGSPFVGDSVLHLTAYKI